MESDARDEKNSRTLKAESGKPESPGLKVVLPGDARSATVVQFRLRRVGAGGSRPIHDHDRSYTIYHSQNSYLGVVLAERALSDLAHSCARFEIARRPIYIPRDRGLKVADLVGSRETAPLGSYHREDGALFCAAWVEGLDVNEESVVRHIAAVAGLWRGEHAGALFVPVT